MARPGSETSMLPILQPTAGRGDQPMADAREVLARQFQLTKEELQRQLPRAYCLAPSEGTPAAFDPTRVLVLPSYVTLVEDELPLANRGQPTNGCRTEG